MLALALALILAGSTWSAASAAAAAAASERGGGGGELQLWGPGAADPDTFSPIWPSPKHATNGSVSLRVCPATFRFSIAEGNSSVLTAAVARYRSLMFAWGPCEEQGSVSVPELAGVHISVADIDDRAMQLHADESYSLEVSAAGEANLTANTTWGALRGLETLSQLVEWRAEADAYTYSGEYTTNPSILAQFGGILYEIVIPRSRYELRLAPWSITDQPRFPYRGALVDTARHWLSIPALLVRCN